MKPGPATVCPGTVVHHRLAPVDHRFTYPVTQVWLDPERPEALFDGHPLWSSRRPAPVRFRRKDYLDGTDAPLGPAVRDALIPALGRRPGGPLRMLTQPRTWGWLFNPITIYLAWDGPDPDPGHDADTDCETDADTDGPVAALLEVTNTPWKERQLYPVALHRSADGADRFEATFAKTLHVSPFLDEDHRYHLTVGAAPIVPAIGAVGATGATATAPARRVTVTLDVLPAIPAPAPSATTRRIQRAGGVECTAKAVDSDPVDSNPIDSGVVLTTRLVIDQHPVERALYIQALRRNPIPTHRVSLGIHHQAWRLWRRGVPFVAHPRRRTSAPAAGSVS